MNDDEDYTREQEELLNRPTIVIYPAFVGEWIIETRNEDGDLEGRGIATNDEMLIEMLRAALGKDANNNGFIMGEN